MTPAPEILEEALPVPPILPARRDAGGAPLNGGRPACALSQVLGSNAPDAGPGEIWGSLGNVAADGMTETMRSLR